MRNILQDIIFGLRMLKQNVGVSVIAVLALSIGIGLVVTMFSIVNGFIIKGLPFDESDRLFLLRWANVKSNSQDFNIDLFINAYDLNDFSMNSRPLLRA